MIEEMKVDRKASEKIKGWVIVNKKFHWAKKSGRFYCKKFKEMDLISYVPVGVKAGAICKDLEAQEKEQKALNQAQITKQSKVVGSHFMPASSGTGNGGTFFG
jgi:hypothetical protein